MGKEDSLLKALKEWGLTQAVVVLLIISVLLIAGEKTVQNQDELLKSLVVYCVWAGLLAHARREITVYRNTKRSCEPGKKVNGIGRCWFGFLLVLHLVGFLVFYCYNFSSCGTLDRICAILSP